MTDVKRVTTSLTERTQRALALAMETGGDIQVDTINRAVQVYAYLLYQVVDKNAVIQARYSDGSTEDIHLFRAGELL